MAPTFLNRSRWCAGLLALGAALALPLAPAAAGDARPELRGFWADGFNPGCKSPAEADLMLSRIRKANFNAVFAQVRKGGDAYYRSRYEPWANDDGAHFDALEYLTRQASGGDRPVAVHAWINTCAVGKGKSQPLHHIAQVHPDWLSMNAAGSPDDNEAYKIDPGNPDAADWTFRVYLDVARHYDVDGIHFDFVRYGAPTFGYNPASVARFRRSMAGRPYEKIAGTDLPAATDGAWKQWRRDQVSALVRKVYVHAVAIKPRLVVSAATICWGKGPRSDSEWLAKSAAMNRTFQDWQGWLREGILDLACPMTYFQADYSLQNERDWAAFITPRQGRRASTVAVGTWFNSIQQNLEEIAIARAPAANGARPYGIMLYSYAGTNSTERDAAGKRHELQYQQNFYDALSVGASAPFPMPAPMPEMGWKAHPVEGHIKGFAFDSKLVPLDYARVELRGHGRRLEARTDGTGFYAFIALKPGHYTVRLRAAGIDRSAKVAVAAGRVVTESFLPEAGTRASVQSTAGLPGGTPVLLGPVRVLVGSDTWPGNLIVADSAGSALHVRLDAPQTLPLQPGDIVVLRGTLTSGGAAPLVDASAVRLIDVVLPPEEHPAIIAGPEGATPRTGQAVSAKGRVLASDVTGFTLDLDGRPVHVQLAGLKEPGVEAAALDAPTVSAGATVRVEGVAEIRRGTDGKLVVWILPRTGRDIASVPFAALHDLRTPAVVLATFRRPGLHRCQGKTPPLAIKHETAGPSLHVTESGPRNPHDENNMIAARRIRKEPAWPRASVRY